MNDGSLFFAIILVVLLQIIILFLLFTKSSLWTEIKGLLGEQKDKNTEQWMKHQTLIEMLPEKIMDKVNEKLENKFSLLSSGLYQILKDQETAQGNFKVGFFKEFEHFRQTLQESYRVDFEKLTKKVEERLDKISQKVQEDLNEGLKKSNQTFQNIIERLARIDEAQKKIEQLSGDVVSLQNVLSDKKSRGIFGEVQLYQILYSVFGDQKTNVYTLQTTMSNGFIADALLYLPTPIGKLAVDSKFPLENYKRLYDTNLDLSLRDQAQKKFKEDLKKHINDIASKYIIEGETSNQAIMFLPAEAIFAEIHAYHQDLVDFANKKRVWMTSPTTFLAILTTVQVTLNNLEQSKQAHIIQKELVKLASEFGRYKDRWSNLVKHIDNVTKDVKDINVTNEKISKRFDDIHSVNFFPSNPDQDSLIHDE